MLDTDGPKKVSRGRARRPGLDRRQYVLMLREG